LRVLRDNLRAIKTYDNFGFRRDGEDERNLLMFLDLGAI
jgi:RimJ/RimL family protein N-acetyltransferase